MTVTADQRLFLVLWIPVPNGLLCCESFFGLIHRLFQFFLPYQLHDPPLYPAPSDKLCYCHITKISCFFFSYRCLLRPGNDSSCVRVFFQAASDKYEPSDERKTLHSPAYMDTPVKSNCQR